MNIVQSDWSARHPVGVVALVYAISLVALAMVITGFALAPGAIDIAERSWGGLAIMILAGIASGGALLGLMYSASALRRRIWPPLPLPGDILQVGVPEVERRSSNWPVLGGSTRRRPGRRAA